MKYEPKTVFVIEDGAYIELPYSEFCMRRESNAAYADRFLIPVHGMLMEVSKEGMLYENVLSQMISAKGRNLYFYTRYSTEKRRNDIEIDFLLSNESKTNFSVNTWRQKPPEEYPLL